MINVTKASLPDLEKYVQYLKKIWQTRWITNHGEYEQLLEKKLKDYLQLKELILVSNGTMALHLALRSLDLRGEVITTPFTFVATTNAILWERLTPVFADINPETFNIDPEDVKKKITKKTSAILAVHIYGNPCNIEQLQSIATENNLRLIFDGSHAFGVKYKNQAIFNYGDVSTLSFHATKVFTTIEGGALVTKNNRLSEKLRLMSDNGIESSEKIVCLGTNAKMNEFQAAMGLCNLEHVKQDINCRRLLYNRYVAKLGKLGEVKFQKLAAATKYNYAYMPVLLKNKETRDKVYNELANRQIRARKYFYPLTVCSGHFGVKKNLVRKYNLLTSLAVAERVLCLPLYPELPHGEVDRIAEIVTQVLSKANTEHFG